MKRFDINSQQYINHQKKESNYMRILSLIINDVKSVETFFPTLVDVQLSKDSRILVLYMSFKNYETKALEQLNRAKGFVRSELAKSINTKYIPEIIFKIDNVSKNGKNIDDILKELKEQENEK